MRKFKGLERLMRCCLIKATRIEQTEASLDLPVGRSTGSSEGRRVEQNGQKLAESFWSARSTRARVARPSGGSSGWSEQSNEHFLYVLCIDYALYSLVNVVLIAMFNGMFN